MNKSQIRIIVYIKGVRTIHQPTWFYDTYLEEALKNKKETKILIV
jgi:hypothetical protein